MRAMILAAGKGSRLLPLTQHTPKPLLKIKGKPLIEYHLDNLKAAGIQTVVVNLHHLGNKIKTQLQQTHFDQMNILFSEEETLLDTGGGIVKTLPLLGNEPFLVISGDILTAFPYHELKLPNNNLAHLILVKNPSYHPEGDYALDEHGFVSLTNNTPKLTYANIGLFHPDFFQNAPTGPFPLSLLLTKHIHNRLVSGEVYLGPWHNIGTIEELQLAESS